MVVALVRALPMAVSPQSPMTFLSCTNAATKRASARESTTVSASTCITYS